MDVCDTVHMSPVGLWTGTRMAEPSSVVDGKGDMLIELSGKQSLHDTATNGIKKGSGLSCSSVQDVKIVVGTKDRMVDESPLGADSADSADSEAGPVAGSSGSDNKMPDGVDTESSQTVISDGLDHGKVNSDKGNVSMDTSDTMKGTHNTGCQDVPEPDLSTSSLPGPLTTEAESLSSPQSATVNSSASHDSSTNCTSSSSPCTKNASSPTSMSQTCIDADQPQSPLANTNCDILPLPDSESSSNKVIEDEEGATISKSTDQSDQFMSNNLDPAKEVSCAEETMEHESVVSHENEDSTDNTNGLPAVDSKDLEKMEEDDTGQEMQAHIEDCFTISESETEEPGNKEEITEPLIEDSRTNKIVDGKAVSILKTNFLVKDAAAGVHKDLDKNIQILDNEHDSVDGSEKVSQVAAESPIDKSVEVGHKNLDGGKVSASSCMELAEDDANSSEGDMDVCDIKITESVSMVDDDSSELRNNVNICTIETEKGNDDEGKMKELITETVGSSGEQALCAVDATESKVETKDGKLATSTCSESGHVKSDISTHQSSSERSPKNQEKKSVCSVDIETDQSMTDGNCNSETSEMKEIADIHKNGAAKIQVVNESSEQQGKIKHSADNIETDLNSHSQKDNIKSVQETKARDDEDKSPNNSLNPDDQTESLNNVAAANFKDKLLVEKEGASLSDSTIEKKPENKDVKQDTLEEKNLKTDDKSGTQNELSDKSTIAETDDNDVVDLDDDDEILFVDENGKSEPVVLSEPKYSFKNILQKPADMAKGPLVSKSKNDVIRTAEKLSSASSVAVKKVVSADTPVKSKAPGREETPNSGSSRLNRSVSQDGAKVGGPPSGVKAQKELLNVNERKRSLSDKGMGFSMAPKRSRLDMMIEKLGEHVGKKPSEAAMEVVDSDDDDVILEEDKQSVSPAKSKEVLASQAKSKEVLASQAKSKEVLASQADSKEMTEVKSKEVIETKNEKPTEVKDEEVTKAKDEKVPEVKDEKVPEVKEENMTIGKNEEATEAENKQLADIKPKDVADAKSEAAAEIKQQEITETKSKDVAEPGTSSDDKPLDKPPDQPLQVSSQVLQSLIKARVRAFIKSQRHVNIEKLNRRTRSMQSATNLWKETAKHLERSVLELTVFNQKLEKRKAHSNAVKQLASRTIGVQVSDEKLKTIQASVNGTPPKRTEPPVHSSASLSLPPSVFMNPAQPQQNQQTPRYPQNPQGLVTRPGVRSPAMSPRPQMTRPNTPNRPPQRMPHPPGVPNSQIVRQLVAPGGRIVPPSNIRTPTAPAPAKGIVNLIDLTDEEDSIKKTVSQTTKPTPSQPAPQTISKLVMTGKMAPLAPPNVTVQQGPLPPGSSGIIAGPNSHILHAPIPGQAQLINAGNPGLSVPGSQYQLVSINNTTASRPGTLFALVPGARPGPSTNLAMATGQPSVPSQARAPQIAAPPALPTATPITPKTTLHSLPPSFHISNKHPAPLPANADTGNAPPTAKKRPPKPGLKISRVSQGIVLSWNMPPLLDVEKIASYQLFAYQETDSSVPRSSLWKKVGDVKALPLPMACTLTQFQEGNKYHFAVRAVDQYGRCGVYSDPSSIFLGPKA